MANGFNWNSLGHGAPQGKRIQRDRDRRKGERRGEEHTER